MSNLSITFHKHLISSSWVIQLTDKQTDTGENIAFLAELRMRFYAHTLHVNTTTQLCWGGRAYSSYVHWSFLIVTVKIVLTLVIRYQTLVKIKMAHFYQNVFICSYVACVYANYCHVVWLVSMQGVPWSFNALKYR